MYHHQNLQRGGRALVRTVGLAVIAFCCSNLVRAAKSPEKDAAQSPELVSVRKI